MKESVFTKSRYSDYLLIVAGTALMALAINLILDPAGLVTGGFSGLAIVIKSLTETFINNGIPIWLSTTVLNVPLFLIGFKLQGAKYLGKTLFGAAALSVWLYLIPEISAAPDDLLLSSIFGGGLQGLGIGLVFIGHATTGGTDMAAALLQRKHRHYTVAQIMQVIDGMIVLTGVYAFGISKALYSVISIVVMTKFTDTLIEGLHFAVSAYIITEKPDEIASELMLKVDRGVTGIDAKGMYTGNKRTMLYCVAGKKQIVVLKDIVMKLDPDAFVIVTDAKEVLGEGFIENTGHL